MRPSLLSGLAILLASLLLGPNALAEPPPDPSAATETFADLTMARELRARESFEAARRALAGELASTSARADARTLDALLASDLEALDEALELIEATRRDHPESVEAQAAAAYIHRQAGNPGTALAAATRALEIEASHREARRQQVFALNDLNGPARALELARDHESLFSPAERFVLRGQYAAGLLRQAGAHDTDDERQRRQALTEQAIAVIETLLAEPELPADQRPGLRHDLILGLRQAEAMDRVVDEHDALVDEGLPRPFWVDQAAADAWLALREPERAIALYQRVLDSEPRPFDARLGLFYALLEAERFDQAIDHIDALAAEKPALVRPGGGPPIPYWNRLSADLTAAMARAFANQPGAAQQRLEALLADAPASAQIRRELATVYRWRGWPERALEQIELANAREPEVVAGRRIHAATLTDLEDFDAAGERIEALYAEFPDNTHVERQHRAWQDRSRWQLRLEGEYGDSDGFTEFGSRDRAFETRLSSPWLDERWRVHLFNQYRDARFPEGQADDNRIGIGLSWRQHRRHAYLEAHRDVSSPADSGLTAGFDQHFGDHWSVATRVESFSLDVPLRARGQGIDGWKAEAAARWQAHESLSVRAGVSRLDLSDGNVRLSGLLSAPHRLRGRAHHITSGRVDLYASRASQQGGPYFNPSRDASAGYELDHEWLTWRHYGSSFTQRFALGAGGYWQEDFGSHAVAHARYEHRWQWHDNWQLRYGVGWASRVYDGNRERRLDARIMLQGYFR